MFSNVFEKVPTFFFSLRLSSIVGLFGACFMAVSGCSTTGSNSDRASNYVRVGSFEAKYDAQANTVTIEATNGPGEVSTFGPSFALSPNETAGVSVCAIRDHSTNECLGLLDPDSCTPEWNPSTKRLSFFTNVTNKSNLPNDYPGNPTGYEYTDLTNFPPSTTFFAPFDFIITGITSSTTGLVTSVNTSRTNGVCGDSLPELELGTTKDDTDNNSVFDCVFPDKTYDTSFEDYPGWPVTDHVPSNRMDPGDSTGCAEFMQFALTANESFTLFFDVLAVKDDGSLPSTPTATSHSNNDFVNTASVTVSGNNCTFPSGTVYIEGGSSIVNTACTAGGNFSVSVPMNLNETNNLVIYQIDTGKQSAASSLDLIHDNIAPTVIGSTPADGATSVDVNSNCVLSFSEAVNTTTLNASNLSFTRVSNGADYTGTITPSGDETQVSIASSTSPLNGNNNFTCSATTGVTDKAGNALASAFTTTFQTGGTGNFFQDKTPPNILSMIPFDNTPDASPGTAFTIRFSEPVDSSTIVR